MNRVEYIMVLRKAHNDQQPINYFGEEVLVIRVDEYKQTPYQRSYVFTLSDGNKLNFTCHIGQEVTS